MHDVGHARIAAVCPELDAAVNKNPWSAWLPSDWNKKGNQLSAPGLIQLSELLQREQAPPPATGPSLNVDRLTDVLNRATDLPAQQRGWWARMKRWIREFFTPGQESQGDGIWRRLFGDEPVGERLIQLVAYSSLALLVALALAIILNELRVAGIMRRPRRTAGRTVTAVARRVPGITEVASADPARQPALILELVVATFTERQVLPPARAFTGQELLRCARLVDAPDRARLAELVAVCDRLRFSGSAVAPQLVTSAVGRGRELLERAVSGAISVEFS